MSQIKTKFVANNAITNTKLAQTAAFTLLGNNSGSTANAASLSVSQVNTMLGTILANGTIAFSGNQSLGGFNLTNVADPSTAQMAATKNYVDIAVAALQPLASVYAATTSSNIPGTYSNGVAGVGATFTTTSTSTFTLDGTTPPLLSRILIKDQTSGFQNGVYSFTTAPVGGISGAIFTRTLDYDTASDMNAAGLIPVLNGTTNALSSWQQTATITTVGSDSLVFQEFTANPSLYLLKANNLNDVANKTTAFNNLSPNTTSGDITYFNGSNNVRLAGNATSSVQFLQSVNSALSYSVIPSAGLATYFFINSASDIGGYFIQQQAPSTTAGQTQSFTGLATGTDTTLTSFATPVGYPNLTFLPPGVTTAYLTAQQTSGSRTVQLYANMYSRTSGGAETLLSTTALTAAITGVSAAYIFQGVIPSSVSLNTTDRLVTKIVARVSAGAGPSVNVTISMQDATSARTEFPASAVDVTNFVPYTGALLDVNLGSHALTTSGTLTGSNLSGTNTGDVTLAAVGSSPSANGASLSGQALTLQPADGTHPGLLTSGTQTIGGSKTLGNSAGDALTIGAASSTAIHQINGGINYTTITVTNANRTIDTSTTDYVVLVNTSTTASTITLPAPTNGRIVKVVDIGGNANSKNITVSHHASETVLGATSFVMKTNYGSITLVSDGTNWGSAGSTLTTLLSQGQVGGVAGVLGVANGGTNIASYATGDILYASGSVAISKLAVGSTGNVLTVASGLPSWAAPTSTFTGDITASTGNVLINTIGKTLGIKTGSNAKIGTAVLSSGTVTVANTSITANSRIFVTSNTDGGTPGWLRVSTITASTSFVITSSSNTDTSTVAWIIVESIP